MSPQRRGCGGDIFFGAYPICVRFFISMHYLPNLLMDFDQACIDTRGVFYVRREVDLIKTAKVNAYIMHIFGKIELLSIHATLNYFKIHYFNVF